jgi:hypothetical protein
VARSSGDLLKIAYVLSNLGMIGAVVGVSFCLAGAPAHQRGLFIGLVSVAGVGAVFHFALQLLPVLQRQTVRDDVLLAMAGQSLGVDDKLVTLILEGLFVAFLILLALCLAGLARGKRAKRLTDDAGRAVWLAGGFGGGLVLLFLWSFVSASGATWPYYIAWLVHWAANVVLAMALFYLTSTAFRAR